GLWGWWDLSGREPAGRSGHAPARQGRQHSRGPAQQLEPARPSTETEEEADEHGAAGERAQRLSAPADTGQGGRRPSRGRQSESSEQHAPRIPWPRREQRRDAEERDPDGDYGPGRPGGGRRRHESSDSIAEGRRAGQEERRQRGGGERGRGAPAPGTELANLEERAERRWRQRAVGA